jgi:hypothetical protein
MSCRGGGRGRASGPDGDQSGHVQPGHLGGGRGCASGQRHGSVVIGQQLRGPANRAAHGGRSSRLRGGNGEIPGRLASPRSRRRGPAGLGRRRRSGYAVSSSSSLPTARRCPYWVTGDRGSAKLVCNQPRHRAFFCFCRKSADLLLVGCHARWTARVEEFLGSYYL